MINYNLKKYLNNVVKNYIEVLGANCTTYLLGSEIYLHNNKTKYKIVTR